MARPLIKTSRAGKLYVRPASVTANIDGAIDQDLATIKRRLEVTDKTSPDFLRSECLVHLSREFNRRNEQEKRDAVVWVLLCRCEANLKRKVDAAVVPNAENVREEILGTFALMLASDGEGEDPDELDFFEVRFNRAFAMLRVDIIRQEHRVRKRFRPVPFEPPDGDDEGGGSESITPSCQADQEDWLAASDILDQLPPNVRKAVVLCHLFEYEIESEDSQKVTAATLCGVSGRTIRNWLKQAQKCLPQFNEE